MEQMLSFELEKEILDKVRKLKEIAANITFSKKDRIVNKGYVRWKFNSDDIILMSNNVLSFFSRVKKAEVKDGLVYVYSKKRKPILQKLNALLERLLKEVGE